MNKSGRAGYAGRTPSRDEARCRESRPDGVRATTVEFRLGAKTALSKAGEDTIVGEADDGCVQELVWEISA